MKKYFIYGVIIVLISVLFGIFVWFKSSIDEQSYMDKQHCDHLDDRWGSFYDKQTDISFCYKYVWGKPYINLEQEKNKISNIKIAFGEKTQDNPIIIIANNAYIHKNNGPVRPDIKWAQVDLDIFENDLETLFGNEEVIVHKNIKFSGKNSMRVYRSLILDDIFVERVDYFFPKVQM